MSTGGMRAREAQADVAGPEALLEAATLALRGELERAGALLCRAAQASTGAVEARLELRTPTGLRLLARAGLMAEGPASGALRPGEQAIPLEGGMLRLRAPRAPLPHRGPPILQLCNAVLARARDAASERAWRHARRREQALTHGRQEAAERQRRRVVHDLRAPLVVIKGYTDMLLRGLAGPLPPEATRYLDRVAAAAERQRTLLEEAFPKGRLVPPGPRTLAHWLAPLAQALEQLAARRALRLARAVVPGDCPLEAPAHAVLQLRRAWLRAIAGSARPGGRVSLEVTGGEGGWAVESYVEVAAGRALRHWAVLAEQARREALAVEVTPGPFTRARWTVGPPLG